MLSGFIFYFFILFFSMFFLKLYSYTMNRCNRIKKFEHKVNKTHSFFLFLFACSFIIYAYTFRYGIGTDYFAYELIYEDLKKVSLFEYIEKHNDNIGSYYVEPGYFILNRYLCFNYRSLLFTVSITMMGFLYYGIISVNRKSTLSFALFIYFCTQFIYSMNGVRFSIAVTIILFGFQFILKRKMWYWILCVILAMGFHKTAVICAPLYFLKDIQNKKLDRIRNFCWYSFVLLFPIFLPVMITFVSNIGLFDRYFSVGKYQLGTFGFQPMFLFHIIPVFLPLLIIKRRFILNDKKAFLLFNMCLYEIPLREIGSLNTWLTRLARYPQVLQVLFVPYVLQSIKNSKLRLVLKIYYILWYVFYFIYTAIVNDAGDSLPYISIFANGGSW